MTRNELIKWLSNKQDQVGYTLNLEGISAKVTRVVQAPIVVTFQLQLIDPVKSVVDKMRNMAPTFEQHLGVAPIRVYPHEGLFHVELPSPQPVTPHGDLLAEQTSGANLCVGYDTLAQPVFVRLPRYPSILWVAPPGAGKTSSVRSIIYSILKNNNAESEKVSVLLCAEKLEPWRAFTGLRGVMDVVSDFTDMLHVLKVFSQTLTLKARKAERFDPPVIIVVDDLLRVLSQQSEIAKYLGEIASTGRSVGLYLFLVTQSSGSNFGTGGLQVEDNIAARIIYRTTSKTSAARSTGQDAAGISELTTVPGDAVLVLGSEKCRIATGYVEDTDIVQLASSDGVVSRAMKNLVLDPEAYAEELPKLKEPINIGDHNVKNKITPNSIEPAQALVMQRISPPRELEIGEIRHLRLIIKHYQGIGKPLSKNGLMDMLFGGKNGTYQKYLQTALDKIGEIDASEVAYV